MLLKFTSLALRQPYECQWKNCEQCGRSPCVVLKICEHEQAMWLFLWIFRDIHIIHIIYTLLRSVEIWYNFTHNVLGCLTGSELWRMGNESYESTNSWYNYNKTNHSKTMCIFHGIYGINYLLVHGVGVLLNSIHYFPWQGHFCFFKICVRLIEWHSYSTGVTAAWLQWPLSNMKVISKRGTVFLNLQNEEKWMEEENWMDNPTNLLIFIQWCPLQ